MNKLTILLTILGCVFAQAARVETVETAFSCQEDDGDQWIEVGIAMNDGPGFRALIVKHDEDDQSAKLVASRHVFAIQKNGVTVYEDHAQTIRLVVMKTRIGFAGRFSLLVDGPGSINEAKLDCFKKSKISFEKAL